MKTVSRMMFALSLLATVNPLWAADDSPSGFYALESLTSMPRDGKQLKPLSDGQLANVEGGFPLHRFGSSGRIHSVRHQILTLFVLGLLGAVLQGNGITTTVSPQQNFLVQLNIAIGNNIIQSNNAVQYNNSFAIHHLR